MTEPVRLDDALASTLDAIVSSAQRCPRVRTGMREPITPAVRLAVLFRDGFECDWWCRPSGQLNLEHIIPWSAGGSDRTDNLRPLCPDCNKNRSNYPDPGHPRRIPCAYACDHCDRNHGWPPRRASAFVRRFTREETRRYALAELAFHEQPLTHPPAHVYCVVCASVSWASVQEWII